MKRSLGGLALAAALLATGLSGCGDADAVQREAFVAFLQTRIIDKPGLRVPQLTEVERASFGPYAGDYGVIADFHRAMNESVSPKLAAAMAQGAVTSVGDLVAKRSQLDTARTTLGDMAAALGGARAKADAARGALNRPADVKVAFDAAYARLVTAPADTFARVQPVADRAIAEALDLGRFIEQRQSEIKIDGAMLQVSNPETLKAINERLTTLQANQQAVRQAQTEMTKMVYGSGR